MLKPQSIKNVYADVSDLPSNADDTKEYFEQLSNDELEAVMFQLAIDLKSIEGQFYASRARYFAGESTDYDKVWHPKMRSVQAIKVVQLMRAEKEFESRVWAARKAFEAELKKEKAEGNTLFLKRFYKVASKYLEGDTLTAIQAFINGRHSGLVNRSAHRAMLPQWDELKRADNGRHNDHK